MLNKKFVVGFDRIRDRDVSKALMEEVGDYIDEAREHGWRDKELKLMILIEHNHQHCLSAFIYFMFHVLQCIVFVPIVFPSFLFNYPIMMICKFKVRRRN